ncbi:MAG: hypothetical protein JXA20_12455, partial [Spirochaetes bacterium]|nr:hypothetical protein [Spirochaetota bacterium]
RESWRDRRDEVLKTRGYASARWALAGDRMLELKLYAGNCCFQVEWQYTHGALFHEAEEFKRSIYMHP